MSKHASSSPCREMLLCVTLLLQVRLGAECVSPSAAVLGWWPGESNTMDLAGSNHGLSGRNLGYGQGRVGQAFFFDGSDTGVDVPASANLDIGASDGLTVEGWIRPLDIDQWTRFVLGWSTGLDRGVQMWLRQGGGLQVWLSPTVNSFDTGSGVLATDSFRHIALTYDVQSGIARILRNGHAILATNLGSLKPVTHQDFHLAHQPEEHTRVFYGFIDELTIYNRALTEEEIQEIYVAGASGKCTENPPYILRQPQSQDVLVGGEGMFTVEANAIAQSGGSLLYQWQFQGTNISGATNRQLAVSNAQLSDSGSYSVTVSNSHGSVLSSNAVLNVKNPGRPGEVVICDETNFLAAVANAAGSIRFDCDGTIALTQTITIDRDTILNAEGHNVMISGRNSVRLFVVEFGVTFTVDGLTLANGRAQGTNGTTGNDGESVCGGAILNNGGSVILSNCTLTNNYAIGGGGGPFNGTRVGDGGSGQGGAVCNIGGSVVISNSFLISNVSTGGFGATGLFGQFGAGGDSFGGAVYSRDGNSTLMGVQLVGNTSFGGLPGGGGVESSGRGGSAFGGALVVGNGALAMTNSNVRHNSVVGRDIFLTGQSAGVGHGGGAYLSNCVANMIRTTFATNSATGGRHIRSGDTIRPGDARGGAIYNVADLQLGQSSFYGNTALGGSGAFIAAHASGGAVHNASILRVHESAFVWNQAAGGAGGSRANTPAPGANGSGGAIYNAGTLLATNLTLAHNYAKGGDAGLSFSPAGANGGDAAGGAIFNQSSFAVVNHLTISMNSAAGGRSSRPDSGGLPGLSLGGGIATSNSNLRLQNTILAFNTNGSNCFGRIVDDGNNISSDASCPFTAMGSLSNTDPVLAPLGDYGGATLTMALLAGSPAINHALATFCPATDQRGWPRPHGSGCDVGSFESGPPFSIRGTIRGFIPFGGIPVYAGSTSSVSTATGNYVVFGLSVGTHTVAPSSPAMIAIPNTRSVSVGPDVLGIDFKSYRFNGLTAEGYTNGVLHLVFAGTNTLSYEVQKSTTLTSWLPFSTNAVGTDSIFHLFHTNAVGNPCEYFRTRGR